MNDKENETEKKSKNRFISPCLEKLRTGSKFTPIKLYSF